MANHRAQKQLCLCKQETVNAYVCPFFGHTFHRFHIGRREMAEDGSSPSSPWTNQWRRRRASWYPPYSSAESIHARAYVGPNRKLLPDYFLEYHSQNLHLINSNLASQAVTLRIPVHRRAFQWLHLCTSRAWRASGGPISTIGDLRLW